MRRWMKVLRSPRSFRRGDVGVATQNVFALTPGVEHAVVLASEGRAAAVAYDCENSVPFQRIDRDLDDVDVLRIETERGVGLPRTAYQRHPVTFDPKRGWIDQVPDMHARV